MTITSVGRQTHLNCGQDHSLGYHELIEWGRGSKRQHTRAPGSRILMSDAKQAAPLSPWDTLALAECNLQPEPEHTLLSSFTFSGNLVTAKRKDIVIPFNR